ncbi:MAG: PAS domain-containing protein, partial [Spirochaetota bacterium]
LSSHTEPAIVHKTESITSYGYVVKNSGETVLITSIKMAFRLHHAQTELLQSRAALSESEEKYRAAFVTSPDSITINSSQGIYVDVNDGFTVLTGYERDEVIGKLPKELNIWVSTEEQESFETQLKLRGLVQNLEARLRCRDGSIVTTLISARPIAIHDRIHILSITRDITQKKLIEDKLIMSEKRFKSMFNLSTEGILIGNNDGIITDANESLVRLCGYSRNELIGRKIDILFSAAVLEEDPLRYDLVRQGSVVRKKRPIITRDGTELMIVMSAAKVADDCLQMVFFQLAADQTAV